MFRRMPLVVVLIGLMFWLPSQAHAQAPVLRTLLERTVRWDGVHQYNFTASNSAFQGKLVATSRVESIVLVQAKVMGACPGSWKSGSSGTYEVNLTIPLTGMNASCKAQIALWLPSGQMEKAIDKAYFIYDSFFMLSPEERKQPISTLGQSPRLGYVFAYVPSTTTYPYSETVGRVCTSMSTTQRDSVIAAMKKIHGDRKLWIVDADWLVAKTGWYTKLLDGTRVWGSSTCAPSSFMRWSAAHWLSLMSN